LNYSLLAKGSVTGDAEACAASQGDNCPSDAHVSIPEATTDGAQAVADAKAAGASWLNPKLATFEVGWAYVPSDHTYYFCIVDDD
jgi:hypothetical protein